MLSERFALYYAPARDDPLWQAGCSWTGRDPENGVPLAQPDLADIALLTTEPRRYGFHATLKPPFRPTAPLAALHDAVRALAGRLAPFALPTLHVAPLGGALALLGTTQSAELRACCDAAVAGLDHLRAPAPAEELARRRAAGLSPLQEAMLAHWGYPYVFDAWEFHMSLTGRLNEASRARLLAAAQAHFAAALALPRTVDGLALYHEAAPGAPFRLIARYRFGG